MWLQLRNEENKLAITGKHDIDAGWLKDMREGCDYACPLITPRVMWEANIKSMEDVVEAGIAIKNIVYDYQFDGVVLELGSLWSAKLEVVTLIIEKISEKLISNGKSLILVLPMGQNNTPSKDAFVSLSNFVSAFTLNSYDYSSNLGNYGPNAPLNWQKGYVQLHLFLSLLRIYIYIYIVNFYIVV